MKRKNQIWNVLALAACLIVWHPHAALAQTPTPVDADILLRGGTLHLGDGQPAKVGDVAIAGDRIVAVGRFPVKTVRQEIDCRGLVVCPGFIDLHNHSDRQVLDRKTRAVINYTTQGCTTIVTGNCGSGPVDVAAYYQQIDQFGVGVNVAHLLPQGSLRRQVIGREQRSATIDELARMKQLTSQAMQVGAWGMSTGLIYVPSTYADTDELVELAGVVSRHGGIYVSHIRNENVQLLAAVEEAMEIGRRADLPVHISHFKSSGKDSWGLVRVAARMIDQQRSAGRRITADQYPYTASSTSLDATLIPTWARAGGRRQMLSRLDDQQQGPRIRSAMAAKLRVLDDGMRLQIAGYEPQPTWAGRRVAQIARDENVEPLELVLRIVRNGGASIVNHSMNEEDVRFVMTHSWVATASDGRAYVPGPTVPHPRNYGTFPRKIGHYAIREQAIPLEHAIRSATGLPADILGIEDRGYLRPGYWADVIVWDPALIVDTAKFDDPHNYSQGMEYVLVNGQPSIVKGSPTGALLGRALRRESADSSSATDSPAAALRGDVEAKTDALLASWNKADSPGCAVGVIRDGKIVYRRGFGSANLDYQSPIGPDSVFYLASVSKQFVATSIALLAIEGKLGLDDDVREYIPELPDYGAAITLRQLVHHTSGLRDYMSLMDLAGMRADDVHSREQLLELICRQKELNFQPGRQYLYCNTGYFLLAEIVRRVTGQSLRDFADEKIFRPLGMRSTRFHDDRTEIVKNRVISYRRSGSGFQVNYLANWDTVGSGGLLSTVDDLILWERNFYEKNVGGEELFNLLHTPGTLGDGRQIDYAFGLKHGRHNALQTVGHSGSFMGFRTVLLRFPQQQFSVIVLANLADINPEALAKKIADLHLADPMNQALRRYAGRYHNQELPATYEITVQGIDLVLTRHDVENVLKPTGAPDAFSTAGVDLNFTFDGEANVNGFLLSTSRAKKFRFSRSGQ